MTPLLSRLISNLKSINLNGCCVSQVILRQLEKKMYFGFIQYQRNKEFVEESEVYFQIYIYRLINY